MASRGNFRWRDIPMDLRRHWHPFTGEVHSSIRKPPKVSCWAWARQSFQYSTMREDSCLLIWNWMGLSDQHSLKSGREPASTRWMVPKWPLLKSPPEVNCVVAANDSFRVVGVVGITPMFVKKSTCPTWVGYGMNYSSATTPTWLSLSLNLEYIA